MIIRLLAQGQMPRFHSDAGYENKTDEGTTASAKQPRYCCPNMTSVVLVLQKDGPDIAALLWQLRDPASWQQSMDVQAMPAQVDVVITIVAIDARCHLSLRARPTLCGPQTQPQLGD